MKFQLKDISTASTIGKLLAAVGTLLALLLVVTLLTSQLLPTKYSLLAVLVMTMLTIGVFLLNFRKQPRRQTTVLGISGAIILTLISVVGLKLVADSRALLHSITDDSSVVKQDIVATQPFNLYISGIDIYGDISTVSRSDVNIVVTVNPQTKQILLTTIPRDSYVRIAGGGNNEYDKLTHAGIYGVTASVQTAAQLLQTDLSSYARINFTSFMKIVDEIDGIDVQNPVAFKTDSGQVFRQGTLHLNGKDALTFSRERHNLEGGDNDRGVNQERVVAAILSKVSSPSVLSHYQGILAVLSESIETNVSEKSLTGLINHQLDQPGEWAIAMSTITGKGQTGGLSSYAMPSSQLYMFVLDEASVQQAQARIQTTLNARAH